MVDTATTSTPVPDELLRRGDLALVKSSTSERAGLYREVDGKLGPPMSLDRAEWVWVLTCVAPLVLSVFGPEPDPRALSTGPCQEVDSTG